METRWRVMKLKRHPPGKFCVAARKASNALVSRRTVVLVPRTHTSRLAVAAQKIEATVLVWTHAASGSSAWNNARITVFAVPARLSDPEVPIHALRGCLVSGVGQGGNRTLLIDIKNRRNLHPFTMELVAWQDTTFSLKWLVFPFGVEKKSQ